MKEGRQDAVFTAPGFPSHQRQQDPGEAVQFHVLIKRQG